MTAGLDRFARFTSRRELARLESILEPGEVVLHAVEARRHERQGLLVCTRGRILFLPRGMGATESWGQETLERIRMEPEGTYARLILHAPDPLDFSFIEKNRAEAFALAVKSLHGTGSFRPAQAVRHAGLATPAAPEPMTELEKRLVRLEQMVASGGLSREEYAYARRHLLEALGLPGDLPSPRATESKPERKTPIPPWLGEKRAQRAKAAPAPPAPASWPGEERAARARSAKPAEPGASQADSKRAGENAPARAPRQNPPEQSQNAPRAPPASPGPRPAKAATPPPAAAPSASPARQPVSPPTALPPSPPSKAAPSMRVTKTPPKPAESTDAPASASADAKPLRVQGKPLDPKAKGTVQFTRQGPAKSFKIDKKPKD